MSRSFETNNKRDSRTKIISLELAYSDIITADFAVVHEASIYEENCTYDSIVLACSWKCFELIPSANARNNSATEFSARSLTLTKQGQLCAKENDEDEDTLVVNTYHQGAGDTECSVNRALRTMLKLRHTQNMKRLASLQSLQKVFVSDNHVFVLTDAFKGTSLLNEPKVDAKAIFLELALAVQHMHSLGIAHMNIAPQNVLVNEWSNVLLKGLTRSKHLVLHSKSPSYCRDRYCWTEHIPHCEGMSQGFVAPEIVKRESVVHAMAADVWSLGALLWYVLCAHCEYRRIDADEPFFQKAVDGKRLSESIRRRKMDKHADKNCVDLLEGMLCCDPEERLTIEQVLAHPWLARSAMNRKNTVSK